MANGDQQEFCAMANSRGEVARNSNTMQEDRKDNGLETGSDLVNETGQSDYEARDITLWDSSWASHHAPPRCPRPTIFL